MFGARGPCPDRAMPEDQAWMMPLPRQDPGRRLCCVRGVRRAVPSTGATASNLNSTPAPGPRVPAHKPGTEPAYQGRQARAHLRSLLGHIFRRALNERLATCVLRVLSEGCLQRLVSGRAFDWRNAAADSAVATPPLVLITSCHGSR